MADIKFDKIHEPQVAAAYRDWQRRQAGGSIWTEIISGPHPDGTVDYFKLPDAFVADLQRSNIPFKRL